jgi:ABC-type bacteriocin/lantibiotic exporter with double-glycine peptidase domain
MLGSTYGAIFIAVRRLLTQLGGRRYRANRRRFHVTQEATGGVKELKILGLESTFLRRYRDAAFEMANTLVRIQVLSVLPRYLLEAVAFGGMLLLILVLLTRGDGDISHLIPTLGIVATVGLRLIPSLQQIYGRGTSLRQSQEPLMKMHADITNLRRKEPEEATEEHHDGVLPLTSELVLKDIVFTYPGAAKPALRGLSLAVRANSTIGIVGGTGAGKTTLIDVLLGLLQPSSGEITIDGQTLKPNTLRAWQKTLGYVPQTIFLSDGSILENIAFGIPLNEIDRVAAERAARVAAIHDFILSDLPDGYDSQVGERGVRLSGGQRQRVGIARALYHDPSTLIFDEATSALDPMTEAVVMDAVHRISGEKTIVMIAHRLSTVRECDHIFLLREGNVAAQGTFDEIREQDEEFRRFS